MQQTSPIWKWLWNEGGKNLPPSEYEGDIVSFDNPGYTYPKDITIAIEPVQSGSGDPSPTNVRPISGWTGANVWDDPKYGGTVAWNQLVKNELGATAWRSNNPSWCMINSFSADTHTVNFTQLATNGRLVNTAVTQQNHVYLAHTKAKTSVNCQVIIEFERGWEGKAFSITADKTYDLNWIVKLTSGQNTLSRVQTRLNVLNTPCEITDFMVFDLTQMFGSIIADYIYSLEQSTAGAGVAWFKNLFPKDYYSYNEGEETCVSDVNGDPYLHYPITFPSEVGTVYGGTLDVTTGLLTVTHGNIASYNGESLPREWISSMDVYSAGGTPTTGAQVVYELATPQTYQLTPTEVTLLLGENNVWADTGDMSVTLVSAGNTRLEARATIDGTAYTDISAPVIRRAAMQNALSIGNVAAASLSLVIRGAGNIPRSAVVVVEARLNDGETASEWLPQGTFYISRRVRDPVTGLLALECYDALLKAQAVVTELPWTTKDGTPITTAGGDRIMFRAAPAGDMERLAKDMALLLGLEIDPRSVIQTGAPYEITSPDAGATIRDVLSIIAQANGGNWIVTPGNRLRLVPVEDVSGAAGATEDAVDVDGVTGGIRLSATETVTGIRGASEEDAWLIGDDTGIVLEVSLAPVIAAEMAEAMLGRRYQAYSLNGAVCDPAAELGDFVRAGVHGEIASALYDQQITLGPACRCDLGAPGGGEITDEYPYIGTGAKTLTLAKAYAREVSAGAVEQLNHALTQQEIFNRLTDNGETQGLILYNGKLYLNAEYIQAGTLVANLLLASILSIGGTDNGNGGLRILDGDGNVIGTWNKDGITVRKGSITGGTINGAILTLGGSDNTSGTLTVKDSAGNTVATIDNNGVSVSKGNIAGPTVTLGGLGNQSGLLQILDALGNQFGVFDNQGLALETSPAGSAKFKLTKVTNLGNEVVTIGDNSATSGVLDININRSSAAYRRHFTFGTEGLSIENGNDEQAALDIAHLTLIRNSSSTYPYIHLIDNYDDARVDLDTRFGLVFYRDSTRLTSISEEEAHFAGPITFGDAAAVRTNLGVVAKAGDTMTGPLSIHADIVQDEADAYIMGDTQYTNHALKLGHYNDDVMQFYEFGGQFDFIQSVNGSDTLLFQVRNGVSDAPLSVENGGTDATNAADARANIGSGCASGTFETADGYTVTVEDGFITDIS